MSRTQYQAARALNHKRTDRRDNNNTKRELHSLRNEYRRGCK